MGLVSENKRDYDSQDEFGGQDEESKNEVAGAGVAGADMVEKRQEKLRSQI